MSAPSQSRNSVESGPAASINSTPERTPLTIYHFLVLTLAAAGWLFDCMGQRIFVLAREPALKELLGAAGTDAEVRLWGTLATTILMVGWATGGIIFGVFSDRFGRVRSMIITLLGYTIFSGLSGFARTPWEFLIYRLLFGLGVGGMFGAATTLVAESVPAHFRTVALGIMQSFSSVGNMLASLISLKIIPGQENFWGHYSGWQVLFFAGVAPAVLGLPMMLILREPESWHAAKARAATGGRKTVGSISDLFRERRWRRGTITGICLGLSGMVGLWGIAFFSPELITTAFKGRPLQTVEILQPAGLCSALRSPTNPAEARFAARLSPQLRSELSAANPSPETLTNLTAELNGILRGGLVYDAEAFKGVNLSRRTSNLLEQLKEHTDQKTMAVVNRQLLEQVFPGAISPLQRTIDRTRSRGTFLQDIGSFFGMLTFTFVAARFNRRTAFFGGFALCLVSVAYVFYGLKTETDVYWMLPLMGFATLAVFAGYSIYFPELFPTRLRGTGVGFCYNTVRYLAAPFPLLLGWLNTFVPFRTVAIGMSSIYLLGLVALFWAPETRGKPLPED